MAILSGSILHIPEHMIKDRTRIGNDGLWTQYVLAFEDNELRIYSYEYTEYNSDIDDSDIENREDCSHYFYNFDFWLKRDSLKYARLNIEKWAELTIIDLLHWWEANLDEDCLPRDFKERIEKFIKDNFEKVGTLVYQYYK